MYNLDWLVEDQLIEELIDAVVDERDDIDEEKWSATVEPKWHPPEGFFNQPANKLAAGLKAASNNLKQAMGRLMLYKNRAGSNLSSEDKGRLNHARDLLQKLYS